MAETIIIVLIALAIVIYATYLLMNRLKNGVPRYRSFWNWVKHMFEAVWGL